MSTTPFSLASVTKTTKVAILGLPMDLHSSFHRGPAQAPSIIRSAFTSEAANTFTESGVGLSQSEEWLDVGDLEANHFEQIVPAIQSLNEKGLKPLCWGGDHSVTFPVVDALAQRHGPLDILHIDAHPDLYDDFEGNPLSHASPFARIMEKGLAKRLVQVGIRASGPHLMEQSARFGVETVSMAEFNPAQRFEFDGPLYLSCDVDGLDPAFAPGVSHPEPGGMSSRDVLRLIQTTKGNWVGADVVEVNPDRDFHDLTSVLAAKLSKEIMGRLLGLPHAE